MPCFQGNGSEGRASAFTAMFTDNLVNLLSPRRHEVCKHRGKAATPSLHRNPLTEAEMYHAGLKARKHAEVKCSPLEPKVKGHGASMNNELPLLEEYSEAVQAVRKAHNMFSNRCTESREKNVADPTGDAPFNWHHTGADESHQRIQEH